MKPDFTVPFPLLLALTLSAHAADSVWRAPTKVPNRPDQVFLPPGFDDNDVSELVVTGELPNTCFKIAPGEATVDTTAMKIHVEQQAYFYEGCWCLQVLVPYTQTIQLGVLPKGNYTVYVADDSGKEQLRGILPVAVARAPGPGTPGPDDELYAPIRDANFDTSSGASHPTLVLAGSFPSDCMRLRETKVLNRVADVIEVLPVAAATDGPECHAVATPFEARIPLTGHPGTSTLVHIRSMNGQAVNRIYDFP